MPSTIRIVIVLACLLVAGTRDVSACMCLVRPACAAFWRADAVFVGQVTGREFREIEGQPTEILTTLTVLRTFRGEQRPSMVLRGSMNSCSYSFRTGETYLVYASRGVDGRLTGTECSGTKPVAGADEDIAMIQTLPSRSPLGWIYGTVNRAVRDPETRGVTGGRAVGVPVTLTAPGTRATTLTDQEGRFEFVGLAPGTYTVQPTVPATMRAGGAEVVVRARSCSPVYLQMLSAARVSGRLYLADGSSPPRMVPIELRDADVTAGAPEHLVRRTIFSDREGRFTFDQVEPGRYYLGMNTPYPPTADRPYAPRFYPNAGAPTEAYVIEVGDGEQKTGFDFTLLPLSEQEIAPATPRPRSTDSAPPDARPLSSPDLFARRLPFRITFPLTVKGGLDPR
jgi:hypothetical protein